MRIFVCIDGVLADVEECANRLRTAPFAISSVPGALASMLPIRESIAGVHAAAGLGHEVWLTCHAPLGMQNALAERASWVMQHMAWFKARLVITPDVSVLEGDGALVVPRVEAGREFSGRVWVYRPGKWPEFLSTLARQEVDAS